MFEAFFLVQNIILYSNNINHMNYRRLVPKNMNHFFGDKFRCFQVKDPNFDSSF